MLKIQYSRIRAKSCTRGFTLVELLVVISIIGTLAGMLTVAYRGAQQESFTQKTRTTIQKISNILIDCVEEYSQEPLGLSVHRGFPFNAGNRVGSGIPPTAILDGFGGNTSLRGDRVEQTLLLAIRDRLRFEFPDNADDIKWYTGRANVTGGSGADPDFFIRRHLEVFAAPLVSGLAIPAGPLGVRVQPSSRAIRLLRKLSVLQGGYFVPSPGWETNNANAELLYLIIEDANYDGSSALEVFGASEIGDTDSDGFKEFIDAWGRPIGWLRWPAGFSGVVQSHPDPLDPLLVRGSGASARLSIGDEPYDRMGRDPGRNTAFESGPLGVPLVVSAGIDGQFGIRLAHDPIPDSYKWVPGASRSVADVVWAYGSTNPNISVLRPVPVVDPWYPRDNPSQQLGSILVPREAADNITNLEGNASSL